MNLNEQTYRIKQMMGLLSEQKVGNEKPTTNPPVKDFGDVGACKTKVSTVQLDKAKKFLLDWLNNPSTKQRFITSNHKTSQEWEQAYKLSVDIINGVKNINYNIEPEHNSYDTFFYVIPETEQDIAHRIGQIVALEMFKL